MGERDMRSIALKTRCLLLAAIPPLALMATGGAAAQQMPVSIDAWLSSERGNENLRQSFQAYDQTKFGVAPGQQLAQPSPRQPVQTYQPQAAPAYQPQPILQAEVPQPPAASGTLPQQPVQQNTYQVPSNALEKIDRQISEQSYSAGGSRGWFVAADIGLPTVLPQSYEGNIFGDRAHFHRLAAYVDGAVGMNLNNNFSLSEELSFQYAPYDDNTVAGGVTMLALMTNANLEFEAGKNFRPYITAGVGPAKHTITGSDRGIDGSDIVLAYQFGAGFFVPMNEQMSLKVGYKYFGTLDADISSNAGDYVAKYDSHIVMTGLQYKF